MALQQLVNFRWNYLIASQFFLIRQKMNINRTSFRCFHLSINQFDSQFQKGTSLILSLKTNRSDDRHEESFIEHMFWHFHLSFDQNIHQERQAFENLIPDYSSAFNVFTVEEYVIFWMRFNTFIWQMIHVKSLDDIWFMSNHCSVDVYICNIKYFCVVKV